MVSQSGSILEAQAAQCERELGLVLEMDRIRDRYTHDSDQMLAAMVEAVTEALGADVGLLTLVDETSNVILGARSDPKGILSSLAPDALQQIAGAATALHTTSTLASGAMLQASGIQHLLVTPLRIGTERLGSLLLLSSERSFDEGDIHLLSIAASQADSAVLQARTWHELETNSSAVAKRNQQLDIIYRIDRLRDEIDDTNRFLMQVADVLTSVLDADLCMVGLVDEDADHAELRSVNDRTNVMRSLAEVDIDSLLDRALSAPAPEIVPADEILAKAGVQHVLMAPLIIREAPLGAFVLANRDRSFSFSDLELVRAVVSQADSAVDHLRTYQCAQERAQQLEAIYRVDHIRDEAKSELEVLSAVANLVTSTLGADLCLMSLISEDTGQSELKAVEDRRGVFSQLDRDAIAQAVQWAADQPGVATLSSGSPLKTWRLKYLMGAPLIVSGEKLGSLVLASERRPFGRPERELFRGVVSQTDSAVVHARAQRHLEQRNCELETLYRVDQIRDQGYEFGEMLSAVLSELCAAINAEMGFIMLFDDEANQLELRASTADDILSSAGHYDLIDQAANRALYSGSLYAADGLSDWLHSIMCVPLILREQVIGVFGAVNRRGPGGFSADERRLLRAITSQVDTAIFESLDKQRIRNTFQRYVGPNVMEQMLATPEKDWLKGERAHLTVLFSDMRGFTSMSERVDVDLLVEMINGHLGAMTEVVLANEGTLDKFVADEVMAIFGAPVSRRDHSIRAIRTALDMLAAQRALIKEWGMRGYELPPIGIGINTGEMIVGNIGCDQQMDYTVMGDAVNLASRLCEEALGDQILITDSTYELVSDLVRARKLPEIRVKGKENPVQTYEVTGLKE